MYRFTLILLSLVLTGCPLVIKEPIKKPSPSQTQLIILGNVQDAGSPHIGCTKSCCADLFINPDPNRQVVSLGLVDHSNHKSYLFDATPDISRQLKTLKQQDSSLREMPNGIFLTHAHIGHYAGLMYLGKEAISANCVPVYAMPRMQQFLQNDGPWSQLVAHNNIDIRPISNHIPIQLNDSLSVTPFRVPHRDEFSETVGFTIKGSQSSALFIPDIDKWSKWEMDLIAEISKVTYVFVDATFYDGDEIKSRDISEIPHPFVIETMELLKDLTDTEKAKVHFIHLNHTNPLLNPTSSQTKAVLKAGFNIARIGDSFSL
ncbi:MAG: pyrroloquinoline quinone biosynthesis protein B [Bacteroidia bacterium]|jgi:pyrroloquinoline quinone biosynthesis protein B